MHSCFGGFSAAWCECVFEQDKLDILSFICGAYAVSYFIE